MSFSLRTRGLCAALAFTFVGLVAAEPVVAQSRNDRDRYVERYYRENPRDRDYNRWQQRRWNDNDYRRWYRERHREDRRDRRRDAGTAALFGLAAGALLGGTLSSSGAQSGTREVSAPSAGGFRAGSRGYIRYCSDKYRSFDPRTFTFMGNDGRRRFCQ